jgi:hypothetical protein
MGEGEALNLIWFRGGGELGVYFTASGGMGGFFNGNDQFHSYQSRKARD